MKKKQIKSKNILNRIMDKYIYRNDYYFDKEDNNYLTI